MVIYKDGQNILFQTDKSSFPSVISQTMALCNDDVVKVSNFKDGCVVYIDNVSESLEKKLITNFKQMGLYDDTVNITDVVDVKTNKELFAPVNMRNIQTKRNFVLYDMGKYTGLTPARAIEKYGKGAFLALYGNLKNFREDERPFVQDACKQYIRKVFSNTQSKYMREDEIVDVLYTYQEICKEQIDSILQFSCHTSLDNFIKESNINILRGAYDAIQSYLLSKI